MASRSVDWHTNARQEQRAPCAGVLALLGLFLLALCLPRFGFLQHTHPGGRLAHTHAPSTLALGHLHAHLHRHAHPHTHGQGDSRQHDQALSRLELRLLPPEAGRTYFADADPDPDGHTHAFDDSLPVGYGIFHGLLPMTLSIAPRGYASALTPRFFLSLPSARAPPQGLLSW